MVRTFICTAVLAGLVACGDPSDDSSDKPSPHLTATCGDGKCNAREDTASCPSDCPGSCGNGSCDVGENPVSCPSDCTAGCGDGSCDAGEDTASCPTDCPDSCGNGVCGAGESPSSCSADCGTADPTCGNCDDGNICTTDRCSNGQCVHDPLPDQAMSCADPTTIEYCDSGELYQLGCGAVCEAGGYNTFVGCDADALTCTCADLTGDLACDASTAGDEVCVTYSDGTEDIAACQAPGEAGASGMWRLHDCEEICVEAGYDLSTACIADQDTPSQRLCLCGYDCPPCGDDQECDYATGTCEDTAECDSDYDCPYHNVCQSGDCVWAQCTNDTHCGYCERCSSNTCYYCGEGPYGCYC